MSLIDHAKRLSSAYINTFLKERVVFHHVPKCGGTSVGRALRRLYLGSQATVLPDASYRAACIISGGGDQDDMLLETLDVRERLLIYLMCADVRCISAHVRYSDMAYQEFRGAYSFITIMREPIERFISHYLWDSRDVSGFAKVDACFEDFLFSRRAEMYGAQYVEFYSGFSSNADFSSNEAVSAAIARLNNFVAVGSLGRLGAFENKVSDVVKKNVRIGKDNIGDRKALDYFDSLPSHLKRRVEEVCRPDCAVWNGVKSLLI